MMKGNLPYWTGWTNQYRGSASFRNQQKLNVTGSSPWIKTFFFLTLTISRKDIYAQRLTIHYLLPSLSRVWQLLPQAYRFIYLFIFSSKTVFLQFEYKPDWGLVVDRNAVEQHLVLDHVYAMLWGKQKFIQFRMKVGQQLPTAGMKPWKNVRILQ